MSNEQNLRPVKSTEEARERGRQGGIKSGEVRRKNRAAKNAAKMILNLPVDKKIEANLQKMGIEEDDYTIKVAMLARAAIDGQMGNLNAIKLLLSLAEELPDQKIERDRFKLEKEKYQHEFDKYGKTDADVMAKLAEVLGMIKDGF